MRDTGTEGKRPSVKISALSFMYFQINLFIYFCYYKQHCSKYPHINISGHCLIISLD